MENNLSECNNNNVDGKILLDQCPWCSSNRYEKWGENVRGFETVACKECGLIFVRNRLSEDGLRKYYENYLTEVHQADKELNMQRQEMYSLEFNLVNKFARSHSSVLDVGCSGGYFLDIFKKHGYKCYGVEFGQAAAEQAMQKHTVWLGSFQDIEISFSFDIIVFRGVIEHVPYPKDYLDKAVSLLNDNGLIYITSTPNSDSICCKLFNEQWNQHEPETHIIHFKPSHFDAYFSSTDLGKIVEMYFYEETPYAEIEDDILRVAEAIRLKQNNKRIDFRSPPFYKNMMSLIYKKG